MLVIFGCLLVASMLERGKKNSIENPPEKHTCLKILSGVFFVLSLIYLVVGIVSITNIHFPTQMSQNPTTPYGIVKPFGTIPYWGYPTSAQNVALMFMSNSFAGLGFAAYLAFFRRSGTNAWRKLLKVVGIFFMYFFYYSSTDLHYFDMYELFAPTSFIILAVIGLFSRNKANDSIIPAGPDSREKKTESQYMPVDARSLETIETKNH